MPRCSHGKHAHSRPMTHHSLSFIPRQLATKHGKRAQCNMGAKNHAVIMPDAHQEQALNGIIGAAFGAAGQRCMAISVAVFVGSASDMLPALVDKAKALKVGCGAHAAVDIGPLIRSCLPATRLLRP